MKTLVIITYLIVGFGALYWSFKPVIPQFIRYLKELLKD